MRYSGRSGLGDMPASGTGGRWSIFLEIYELKIGKSWFYEGKLVLLLKEGEGCWLGGQKSVDIYPKSLPTQVFSLF